MKDFEYEKILKKAPFGYALHKILLDEYGIPVDFEYVEINDAFEKIMKLNRNQIIGKKITEILPTINDNKFDCIKHYGDITISGSESEFEQYLEELKGWYKIKIYSPSKYYFITYLNDIGNEIKERELFKSTLLSIDEGIIATDLYGKIVIINKTGERLTEWKEKDILNLNIFDVFKVCDDNEENKITESILELIQNGECIKNEENMLLKSKTGIDIPIVYDISPVKDSEGEIYGMVINFRDISEKIAKDKEIDYITYHDGLTGVYNRNFFNEKIISIDLEENLPISIIMGDVNGLKLTNDAFGHLMGDKLLLSAANIMKRVCRDRDIVIRWGGDEFIILLPKTKQEDVEEISERIKNECIKENIDLLNISISLGYDTKTNKDADIMKSVTNAEEMMYKVKMLESKSVKSRTLKIIINTLCEKSEQNDLHSKSVSKICKQIGQAMEMSKEKISELEILGEIHDIGKIGVSESVLNKVEPLNSEDWEEIRKHPQIGYHIVCSSGDISFLGDSILAHQEWYDGSGYPKGLKGEEIPLMARILSIADAYDAMVSYRSYRKSLTKNEAIKEIKKCSGIQFDPNIVEIFVGKVAKKLNEIDIS
ncbi:diguanylate cyclase [Clostridium gelidum]|uniref:Diguanylate cyclase n=1 Tax=Clostridium gelidum TaxID=704125 RepID=A0ABM7TAY9_9CLOT|nr:HD domain-containing phosphohydrolase [Clostridium gelidum]BCZ48917.1 diguanylate cyclase [Clostridium gelidum]